uniref:RIMS-binding protein 2 n=1 Tax=Cacopsylla melanoneura TaxID=428564 RepID=A0A8D8M6V8_9HEMI
MRDVTERKKELEREQAECLATLREKQAAVKFKTGTDKMKCNDTIEALQSKIRELEKKTELQNVQHEELMIELASVKRSTYGLAGLTSSRTGTKDQIAAGSQTQDTQTSPPESIASTLDMNCLDRLTSSHISHSTALDSYVPRSHQRHHMVSASPAPISSATSSSGSASGMGQGGHSAEIDRIMAKIDLDNKILAELDKTRSTVGLPSGTSLQDSIGLRHTGYASTSALSTDPASYLMTNNTMIPIMGQSNLMMGGGGGGLYMLPGGSGAGSTSSAQLQSVLMSQGRIMPSIPGLGTGQYDTDTARVLLNGRGGVGVGGLHFSTQGGVESLTSRQGAGFPTAGHQLQLDKNIEFLDIPGKGRCHVYIARFTYDPTHMSPNDCPESELPIQAGDYVLVWGQIDEDGFYEGELMDGRRGLVPSNYIEKLTGEDLLEFYQTYVLGITQIDDSASTSIHQDLDYIHSARIKRGLPSVPSANRSAEDFTLKRLGQIQDYMLRDILEDPEEEDARSSEGPVMPPKQLTLERQLNKSVLIGWNPPDNTPSSAIDSYHLYVDGVLKATVKSTERTRALVEGVDSNRPHRISVRSITPNRRTSRDAACTMLIGKDVPLCPTNVRASNVTATSAVISWLPSNSNHQHTVCVNNVEVRTVKPGVYRHTITGLAPNTEYRVTVRAKNIRAPNYDDKAIVPIERFSAHVDFRTLPKGSCKGLPEPPVEIQVEPGPQDGTLLVTWLPVTANNSTNHALVTGYAVFADGKKVTDVDSPTGDHALIDINKLVGLNPRQVTVRTKSRDNQSLDSAPATVPSLNKHHHQQHNMKDEEKRKHSRERDRGDRTAVPPHMRPHRNPHGQVIIDSDENMSDKEVYPGNHMIPSIEITKDTGENYAEDDPNYRHNPGGRHHSRQAAPPKSHAERGRPPPPNISSHSRPLHVSERDQQQFHYTDRPGPGNRHDRYRGGPGGPPGGRRPQGEEKRVRWFVALYDYDPFTMSPNPDSAEEELPFNEGDNIKVYGTKDSDGFYWGELKGRRGYVPHNMVVEVDDVSKTDGKNDRWGDIYQNSTTKKMIALYDYDATQMSPNIDTELELSFRTGDIIYVYGGMDDDGFYMGELGGHRGLVPSNFLVEAPDYGEPPPGHGPGARGPPLPPREGVPLARGSPGPVANVGTGGRNEGIGPSDRHSRRKDITIESRDLHHTSTLQQDLQHHQAQNRLGGRVGVGGPGEPPRVGNHQSPLHPNQAPSKVPMKGLPSVLPEISNLGTSPSSAQGGAGGQAPNLMQKLTEITGGGEQAVENMLSKGKELIFMKFGLGK